MALKRKKGHFLVTKTQGTKLLSDKPDLLIATSKLFNQVIEFYLEIYHQDPELADVPSKEVYRAVELLTITTKTRQVVEHPLPYNCPVVFRRAAIFKALGMFKSWRTSYEKWQKQCQKKREKAAKKNKKALLSRPPVLPRELNCSVHYEKPNLVTDRFGKVAMKPTRKRMASILSKASGNACDFSTLLRSYTSGGYVTKLKDTLTEESPKNSQLYLIITI